MRQQRWYLRCPLQGGLLLHCWSWCSGFAQLSPKRTADNERHSGAHIPKAHHGGALSWRGTCAWSTRTSVSPASLKWGRVEGGERKWKWNDAESNGEFLQQQSITVEIVLHIVKTRLKSFDQLFPSKSVGNLSLWQWYAAAQTWPWNPPCRPFLRAGMGGRLLYSMVSTYRPHRCTVPLQPQVPMLTNGHSPPPAVFVFASIRGTWKRPHGQLRPTNPAPRLHSWSACLFLSISPMNRPKLEGFTLYKNKIWNFNVEYIIIFTNDLRSMSNSCFFYFCLFIAAPGETQSAENPSHCFRHFCLSLPKVWMAGTWAVVESPEQIHHLRTRCFTDYQNYQTSKLPDCHHSPRHQLPERFKSVHGLARTAWRYVGIGNAGTTKSFGAFARPPSVARTRLQFLLIRLGTATCAVVCLPGTLCACCSLPAPLLPLWPRFKCGFVRCINLYFNLDRFILSLHCPLIHSLQFILCLNPKVQVCVVKYTVEIKKKAAGITGFVGWYAAGMIIVQALVGPNLPRLVWGRQLEKAPPISFMVTY